MHTMTKRQSKSGTIDVKAVLGEDGEFLRALVRTALQEVLEVEMTEVLGDLSPVSHPGMSRVGWPFEPGCLGGATGRGAEPPIARSVPSRCDAWTLRLA
jgi:hypothetical protein